MATIIRVQGNRLELAIPLQTETITSNGKTVADYIVPADAQVKVLLISSSKAYEFEPLSISGNVVTMRDDGKLPVGKYAVEVRIRQADGTPLRSKYCNIVDIRDCNDGVATEYNDFIEGSTQLDAQIFYFAKGDRGYSAYEIAVQHGYLGTEEEWINGYDQFLPPAEQISAALSRAEAALAESARLYGLVAEVASTEQGRVDAEAARVAAEALRAQAETLRVQAEQARQTAEQGRADAEAARQTAERARQSAEETRQSAFVTAQQERNTEFQRTESERAAAEAQRLENESVRQQAEAARNSAEATRQAAEALRLASERQRQQAENARVSAEQTRVSSETLRQQAELQRIGAEAERAAAEILRQQAIDDWNRSRIVEQTATNIAILPNVRNHWATPVSSLTLSLTPGVAGYENEYMLEFTVAGNDFSLDLPTGIRWPEEPSWEAGNTYQVSIIGDLALYAGWEAAAV